MHPVSSEPGCFCASPLKTEGRHAAALSRRTARLPRGTHAFGPSCFMILTAQSMVLLYLWASRPCETHGGSRYSWFRYVKPLPARRTWTDLHPGLDDVQRRVAEHADGAGAGPEQPGHQRVHGLVGVVAFKNKNR